MKINLAAMIKLVADPGDTASPPTGEFHDELHRVMIGAPPGAPPGTNPNRIDQGANPKKPNAEGNKPDLGSKEDEEGSQDTDEHTKSTQNGLASQILAVIQLLPAISPLPNALPSLSVVSTAGEGDLAPNSGSTSVNGVSTGVDNTAISAAGSVPAKLSTAQLDHGMINVLPDESKTFGNVTGLDLGMIPTSGIPQPTGPSFGSADTSAQLPSLLNPNTLGDVVTNSTPNDGQLTVQVDGSGTVARNGTDTQILDSDLITTLNPTSLTVGAELQPSYEIAPITAPVIANPSVELFASAPVATGSLANQPSNTEFELKPTTQDVRVESNPVVVDSLATVVDLLGSSPKESSTVLPNNSAVNPVTVTTKLPGFAAEGSIPAVDSSFVSGAGSNFAGETPTERSVIDAGVTHVNEPVPTLLPLSSPGTSDAPITPVPTTTKTGDQTPTMGAPKGTLDHQAINPTVAPISNGNPADAPVGGRIDASGPANLTSTLDRTSSNLTTIIAPSATDSNSKMAEKGIVKELSTEDGDAPKVDLEAPKGDALTLNISDSRTPLAAGKEAPRSPLTAQDAGTVMRQVIDRLETLSAQQIPHRLTIRLEPEHFGTITISFRGIGAQTHATVTSDNRAVLDALQANKPEFLSVSSNLGLSLNDFSFSSSSGGSMPGQNDNPVDFNRNVQLNQALQPAEDSTTYVAAPLSTDHLDMRI